jgi:hypothetical protein
MLTTSGYEVAIKDINPGEEMTNDYGTLNIIEPFECALGPHERKFVKPDDLKNFYQIWDKQIESAMECVDRVRQPLESFLSNEQKLELIEIVSNKKRIPSVLENFYSA